MERLRGQKSVLGTRKRMEGGRLLDQGTYGCVFDPPLRCKDGALQPSKGKRILGKVSEREDILHERDAALYLSKIPNFDKYFVLVNVASECDPVPAQKQKERELFKCDVIRKVGLDSLEHYTVEYGGVIINKLMKQVQGRTFPLVNFVTRILEIGTVMALNGFVHYDIHSGNILLDEKTMMPRLIDFGMCFRSTEINKTIVDWRWKRYAPEHGSFGIEPTEISVATGLRNGRTAKQALYDSIKYKNSLKAAERMLGMSRMKQARDFTNFWNTSAAAKTQDWVAMFKTYWPAFDAWGFGVYLLGIFQVLAGLPETGEFKSNQGRFKELLRGLLRIDPLRRIDCVEALSTWDPENALLDSAAAKSWLDEKARIREKIRTTPLTA